MTYIWVLQMQCDSLETILSYYIAPLFEKIIIFFTDISHVRIGELLIYFFWVRLYLLKFSNNSIIPKKYSIQFIVSFSPLIQSLGSVVWTCVWDLCVGFECFWELVNKPSCPWLSKTKQHCLLNVYVWQGLLFTKLTFTVAICAVIELLERASD